VAVKKTSNNEPQTMADLLAKAGQKLVSFSSGQKVKAKVISKLHNLLVLDIGGKSEGLVAEKAFNEAREYIKTLKVGDEVVASVLVPETREGNVILSLRQAMAESAWEKLEKAGKANSEVAVYGKGANAAGVVVDIEGLEGFIPASQLGREVAKNPQNLIGKYFKVKVIEVDRMQNKVVLSEREVSEAADIKSAKEALTKIKEGEVYEGKVTTVASFGCFVKLGSKGPEGLVHISEMAWGRIEKVGDVAREGDKVKVKVLTKKDNKLALSLKQAQKNPWEEAVKKYKPESKIKGKVTRISDFGIFVELEPGVEGLVHITKIPPTVRFKEGETVNCLIEEVDDKAKKISLGLVLTAKPIGYK
jgi:small subunit ribosomal protein S1